MLIDTHTHLYDERYATDRAEMLQRAFDTGVQRLYIPNCDQHTIPPMLELADAYPDQCFPMMGLHPCYVKEDFETELAIMKDWLGKRAFSAIGEIGLDYYWDKTFVPQQKIAFERQIDWALERNLPIVIHSRESTQDCIDIVREKQNGNLHGIFHCFSGTLDEAQQIEALGFYLGIGGVVTYKNSSLQQVVKEMPLETLVLETDAPYLTPVPYRGKRNESSYIPLIAAQISNLKAVSEEVVESVTTANAEKIFTTNR